MPFTTLQDRALQIPRQTFGGQYPRANFKLGEVHTILPPVGHGTINCQGIDLPPEGKKLQITKELVALIQAGFIRIAVDITNPDADKHGSPAPDSSVGPEVSKSVESNTQVTVGVSPPLSKDTLTTSSVFFSSIEEIESCQDREKLRLFVKSKNGYENENSHIDGLRDLSLKLFQECLNV
jgi:hypothetical protein